MYLLSLGRARKSSQPVGTVLLQLMGRRLRKVRRLKGYREALRDCIAIVWGSPGSFSDEERRRASSALKALSEAWATGFLSLKDLRRLEASLHLHD